ncbi:MAG: NYN domain-containing protein [Candidatus Lokiarchaeota archaeon]|nr:NYN domain-containing protein [Candidatus Lokiarchaeota archaeon]
MRQRAIIFIDHANLFYNLLNLQIRIDYKKFKEILTRDDHLVGAFMYMGIPEELYPKKKRFLKYLTSQGYVIQARPIKIIAEGKKMQKGLDIFIYRDVVELAGEDIYDKAILVSGDSDFIEIVRKLRDLEKTIEIWSFKRSLSHQLLTEVGDENVYFINEILGDITC